MHLRPKHLLAILAIAAVVGGFLFTKYQEKKSATDNPAKLTHIRMALVNNPVSALAVIAANQGFFTAEGIALEQLPSTSGKTSIDLLIANQADLSLGGGPPLNFLSFTADHPLKLLSATTHHYDTAVYARKDRGIKEESDLPGKKIGYLPGTVSFIYWSRLLERHHWDIKDFEMVPLQPPAMVAALTGESVDAIVVWEPWGYNAMQQLKDNGLRLANDTEYYWTGFLYGRASYINANPDVIQSVIRALLKAESFIKDQPEKAIKIVADFIKVDPQHLSSFWNSYNFKIHLNQETTNNFLLNTAIIKKFIPEYANKPTPDFKNLIDPEPLRAVAPDRVQDW